MNPETPAPPAPPPPSSTPTPPPAEDTEDALEQEEGATVTAPADATSSTTTPTPKPPKKRRLKSLGLKLNIYLILFVIILLVAGGVIFYSYSQGKKTSSSSTIASQSLTQSTLNQLANSDASVGAPKQILNVESNAVFAGQILVREGTQVAGTLQVSGSSILQDLNVSGQAIFNQVQVSKNLSVAGNEAVEGQETIAQSLQVNGNGTFSGAVSAAQFTTSDLQLNGDLTLDHHIVAGGTTPSRQNGPALGNGGTASISGSDTSGTVAINTGSGTSAGCFVTITFTTAFAQIPHVLLTPVGPAGGGLAYYVTHTATNFSICDADTPPVNSNVSFDYFVLD
jgi:cytoskeletal protein CcmA (bactofilin family)